jgi:hypothetical protein
LPDLNFLIATDPGIAFTGGYRSFSFLAPIRRSIDLLPGVEEGKALCRSVFHVRSVVRSFGRRSHWQPGNA